MPRGITPQYATRAGKPATKTVLLHMEDFKIPENLSRFAVKHGMWGFMKQMAPSQVEFIKERRSRGIDPDSTDPNAFGANEVPLRTSSAGGNSAKGSGGTRAPSDGSLSSRGSTGSKVSKLRRVGSTVLAAGMLVALTANGSQGNMRRHGSCRSQASLRAAPAVSTETGAEDEEERADAQQ